MFLVYFPIFIYVVLFIGLTLNINFRAIFPKKVQY